MRKADRMAGLISGRMTLKKACRGSQPRSSAASYSLISYFNCGTVETLPIAIYSMTRKKVSPEIYALSTGM